MHIIDAVHTEVAREIKLREQCERIMNEALTDGTCMTVGELRKYAEIPSNVCDDQVIDLARGTLTSFMSGGCKYYKLHFAPGSGGPLSKVGALYIGRKNELIQKIQLIRFRDEYLRLVDFNLRFLVPLLSKYKSTDLIEILEKLPKAYQDVDLSLLERPDVKEKQWLDKMEKRKRKKPHPEPIDGKNVTCTGLRVRSRVELVIAEKLIEYGITFIYECPLELNGTTVYPDFLIYINGTVYIWEHLGLLQEEKYFKKYFRRFQDYAEIGYNLGVNLMITTESKSAGVNVPVIIRNIEWMLQDAGVYRGLSADSARAV